MNNDRQKILNDYISYLYTTGRTYDTVGKYIKYINCIRRVIIVVSQPYNEIIKLFLVLIRNDIKFFQRFHRLFPFSISDVEKG